MYPTINLAFPGIIVKRFAKFCMQFLMILSPYKKRRKIFFLSCPRYCERGLILVKVYYRAIIQMSVLMMLSVKRGGIKYNFSSLWYESTWDWTPALPSHWRTLAYGRPLYLLVNDRLSFSKEGDFLKNQRTSFFQNFLPQMYTWHCLELVYRIFFNLTKICFEAIQESIKSKKVLKAWTEVYHQISGGWEVQTMWNLQKNVWCVQRGIFKQEIFTNVLNMGLPP